MIPITHLTSLRTRHLKNHFELKGLGLPVRDASSAWWLVFDNSDYPPEFVGDERYLPGYAQGQLARLRAAPETGAIRRARHVHFHMEFLPGADWGGVPHAQNVEWLRQYRRPTTAGRYSLSKSYLVTLATPGNEDYPMQIWESHAAASHPQYGLLDSFYTLVWRRSPDEDGAC